MEIKNKNYFNYLNSIKWGLIFILLLSTFLIRINLPFSGSVYIRMFFFLSLAIFAWIHGIQRYGLKNMLKWFFVTWIVSNGFEGLSVKVGFPFGHYHYTAPGPRIFDVPVYIMIAYFGIVYVSWTVTQAVFSIFSRKISRKLIFIMPVATGIIMTMWDLITDVQSSTIGGTWIWENGGEFFGVPITNFMGWFFVIYCFMQIFTIFMSKENLDISKNNITTNKNYWLESEIVYLIMGMGVFLEGFTQNEYIEIYRTMSMLSIFTVIFVSSLAIFNTFNSKELT